MAILRAQVVIPRDSGLPEDRVVNTWHFLTTSGDQATIAAAITPALADVYTVAPAGSANTLMALLSTQLAPAVTVAFYNLADPTPRVPIYEDGWSISTGSSSLPEEVALCGSFQAVKVSGLAQARRRGRIYFGPFANNSNVVTAFGQPNVATNGIAQTIQAVLVDLKAASDAASTWSWAVYSTVNDEAVVVDNGWVDNVFDTQRRRGPAATSRLLWA